MAVILIFSISLVTLLILLYQAPVIPETNPLVQSYTNASTNDLAILISNRDFSTKDIEKVLQSHGYKSYEDGCKQIASDGILAYVPKFEIDGITYGGYYTTKSTILYHTALEAGIIKE